ncbi:DegT/DnrJ/EryC1/StrS family aminotransferase [Caulobacter segnis]|uniref:DegT/DnrJ/EryC1/StrS family aminotransferase n=1 Tax=Caulobacter segnis TaxID=88688 RepID=UPI00240E9E98|nr:DegT/DnrJ/EryC1/StrS family aminotransferase [Caulobacter segnis]MDG2521279.1 DegT/DnrJ/EryC1/StrS family aminotransferase [Caulobacter segnis]
MADHLPRISVAAPVLDGREREYVNECLDTTWISSVGRFISEFEKAFADYCGVRHAIACNNGTTALHLALTALGLKAGEEVIVPSLTYIASANSVSYCGATPVLAENETRTFNIDPADIEALITPRTRGIMPVHLYGHPAEMDSINAIAKKHNLFVIEDAAEAVGAQYKGRMTGSLGDVGVFSFFGNKIITTGEGGMVTTNDDELAAKLRLLRGQGMDPARRYWFPIIGFNYRMTNIQAAIGLAQLERIDHHLDGRRRVAAFYDKAMARLGDRVILPVVEDYATHVYWMYTIQLGDGVAKSRDQVMLDMDALGIETRPVFHPMHVLPPYQHLATRPFPKAELCAGRGINLPTHALLSEADIDRVVDALDKVLA